MSDVQIINGNFPIKDVKAVSVRIVFAKQSEFDPVWHLVDMATGLHTPDGVAFMALHGKRIYPMIKCDTVLQARLRTGATDVFCYRCLDEYEIARDIIEKRRLMKFK